MNSVILLGYSIFVAAAFMWSYYVFKWFWIRRSFWGCAYIGILITVQICAAALVLEGVI